MAENSRFGQNKLEQSSDDDIAPPNMEKAQALLDYIKNAKMPALKPYERECLSEYFA